MGEEGAPLKQVDLKYTDLTPTEALQVHGVTESRNLPDVETEPPHTILEILDAGQRTAFEKLWERVPLHLHCH